VSEFHVQVVRLGEIEKHPNADTLSITRVHAYPVICKTGAFAPGDLATYVPVDAVVPASEEFAFLGEHRRIKAKRLRGVFSMGLLVPAPPGTDEGEDVRERLGIERYEPPEPATASGEDERDPGFIPVYTDIEGLRRWPDVLEVGEEVVITEKIHGANGRFAFHDGRLWVGSHRRIKREDDAVMWWRAAKAHGLSERLAQAPGFVFYGEVYGQVQDLRYGTTGKAGDAFRLRFFDALSIEDRRYLDFEDFAALTRLLGLERAPILHRGPWSPDLAALAEGPSVVDGADHMREGFVVRPVRERFAEELGGRCILKMIGEGYMLRKEP
jgi:RNA ligase (TIGR02306 family)